MSAIVTLTLNPAIDVACATASVVPQHKLRTHGDRMDPGGGGVNVARVLHELGAASTAIVLAGGVTGRLLEDLVAAEGVVCRAVRIAGTTRICTTVLDEGTGQEYRFVPEGPLVSAAEIDACVAALERETGGGAGGGGGGWLVVSGSLPRGVSPENLAGIVRAGGVQGREVAVDTSGPALRAVLGLGVGLIKPSLRELEALLGKALPDAAAQDEAARRLVREGAATRVAVSLGAEGALLATAQGVVRLPALPVKAVGTVGAGDSFLAAMVLALSRGEGPAGALAWGSAAGAAAVSATGTARPRRAMIEALHTRAATLL